MIKSYLYWIRMLPFTFWVNLMLGKSFQKYFLTRFSSKLQNKFFNFVLFSLNKRWSKKRFRRFPPRLPVQLLAVSRPSHPASVPCSATPDRSRCRSELERFAAECRPCRLPRPCLRSFTYRRSSLNLRSHI